MALFPNPTHTLGLDISDHVIRAVILQHQNRKKIVKKFAEIPLNEGIIVNGVIQHVDEVQASLKTLFSQHHITPKQINAVIGLPELHGFIKTVLPTSASEEKEIQKHLPFAYSEVTIDTEHSGNLLSFAAMKTEIAESYVQTLAPLGIHIRAFEIESQAIARLFASHLETANQATVLGDIGHNHTTFMVVQDGHIDFTHTSKLISGKILTEQIQQQFNVDFAQAERIKIEQAQHPAVQQLIIAHTMSLATELKRVIGFHEEHRASNTNVPQPPPEYIVYLVGSGSQIQNLRQYLEQQIHLPIQAAKISEQMSIPKNLYNQILSYGTAIGLALRDFQPL